MSNPDPEAAGPVFEYGVAKVIEAMNGTIECVGLRMSPAGHVGAMPPREYATLCAASTEGWARRELGDAPPHLLGPLARKKARVRDVRTLNKYAKSVDRYVKAQMRKALRHAA